MENKVNFDDLMLPGNRGRHSTLQEARSEVFFPDEDHNGMAEGFDQTTGPYG